MEDRPVGFDVIVDRSPSMYLPADSGGGLRVDAAVAGGLARIPDASGLGGPRLRFLSLEAGGRLVVHEGVFPEAWRLAPEYPAPDLEVERWDRPGNLLLTDVLATEPQRAAWFTSGATPRPGAIGESETLRWIWDGSHVESQERSVRRVEMGQSVPEPLRSLIEIWASERGFELSETPFDGDGRRPALVIHGPVEPEERWESLEARARGWDLAGAGRAWQVAEAPGKPWLWAGARRGEPARVAVAWSPGEVHVAWGSLREPGGDPAAFALAWAELLDGSLRASEDVIAFEERALEGPASQAPAERWVGSELPEGAGREPGRGRSLEAIAAAVCALLAVGSSLLTSGDDGVVGRASRP